MDLLLKKIEGLLFYKGESMSVKQIADLCDADKSQVDDALDKLSNELSDRGISLIRTNDSAQLATDESLSKFIADLREDEINTDLTSAQSEALSVIAYLAPVSKPKIDFIRGVNSRAVLRNLSSRGLITKGKTSGHITYDLTADAFAHLGITSYEELPDYADTREKLKEFSNSSQKSELSES